MKLSFYFCQKWNDEALIFIKNVLVFVNKELKINKNILPE